MIEQGQIWLLELPTEKRRPCLVLTRNEALPVLTSVLVAPLTTTMRGIPTEVRLDLTDGAKVESVATLDNLKTVRRAYLTRRLGQLAPGRWHEVCHAIGAAIDC